MRKAKRRNVVIRTAIVLLLVVVMLFPFYIIIVNSFKTPADMNSSYIALPQEIAWENYINAWKSLDFGSALKNTLLVDVFANVGLIVFGTMGGYWLIRRPSKFHNFLYYLILASMAIPFQAIMIPFIKLASDLDMVGSLWGLTVMFVAMGLPMVVFLTLGAIKSIPYEIEEAAIIDGCSPLGVFWRIVFPLLKNTTITFTILNVFWVWNEYIMSFLMLPNRAENRVLQMAIRSVFTEYTNKWDIALPAIVVAIVPTVVFFVIAQKWIVEGIASGSVKG